MENDAQFQDHTIAKVRKIEDGYEIRMDDGWNLLAPEGPIKPKVGHSIRLYGRGLGSPIRGIVINGVVFKYETAADFRARLDRELAEELAERRRAYEAWLPQREIELSKLPEVFQRRLNRFIKNAPDTAWDHQGYELAVCKAAVAIIEACGSAEEVATFADLKWDEQMARAPKLDDLGLSGNQFSMACRLAHHYFTNPENVYREHAAISLITGCAEAGCIPEKDG